ncbi:MAG TPA: lipopolysaccharide biosynthesis protein [Rhizobiaceae bacterium]
MADLDLRFYLAIFLRRLPYFIAIVIAVAAIGVAAAIMTPRTYRAEATFLFEAPQVSESAVGAPSPVNALEQLQVVRKQVTTRENLLALADKMNVYGEARAGLSNSEIEEDMQDRLHFDQVKLDASGAGATVFNVSFGAEDPKIAAGVVNEFVELILDRNARLRTGRAKGATQFFSDEVARLIAELERAEDEVLKFKNGHGDSLPDGLEFRRARQGALQERLTTLEREEADLRFRKADLSVGRAESSAVLTPEQQQLLDLNRALSDQLSVFTEDSANVVALRERIARLQEQMLSGGDGEVGRKSPGLSPLGFQVAEIDERIRLIGSEKDAIAGELEQLTRSIEATPATETALSALERDRANIQTQYNSAVARLAEAKTGEQIELLSKGPRFSLVEAATPPEKPTNPSRRRIAAKAALAGIGLGAGFVVLLEFLNKTIRRPMELSRLLGSEPLATIPFIEVTPKSRGSLFKRGAAVLGALGAATAAALAVHHFYPPRDRII